MSLHPCGTETGFSRTTKVCPFPWLANNSSLLTSIIITEDDIDYVPYDSNKIHTFWGHVNPHRMGTSSSQAKESQMKKAELSASCFTLGVPRYQNMFRQLVWITFLFVYSQAVASPLWKEDPINNVSGQSLSEEHIGTNSWVVSCA